jgi:hypothetical protein
MGIEHDLSERRARIGGAIPRGVSKPASGVGIERAIECLDHREFVLAFLLQPSVDTFDHRVFDWLARPTKVHLDFAFIGPAIHRLADEFAAVVRLDRLRRSALACNRIHHAYNVLALQAPPNVNGQTLS